MLADLVAGTMAGFGICAVGHPFDTLKVLMQMQPDKYRGMGDALKETVTRYGPGGLYRGVGAPLIGNGFYNAVQFAIFAGAKRWFTNDGRDPGLLRVAGAGAFTGVFVALVEGPQDLFKSQVQAMMVPAKAAAGDAAGAAGGEVKPPKYTGVADCAKKIIGERGLLAGASQGLTATIARNIVGVSAYFYFYELARQMLAGPNRDVTSLKSWEVLIAGGCGGLGYWVLCYPLDIVKSAIQTDSIYPEQRRYKGGIVGTARQLLAEGGVKRFTAGLAPCLMRSFPANAAGFAVYESVKTAMS